MGCFDVFCSLCGMPLNSLIYDVYNLVEKPTILKKLPSNIKWLNQCTILLPGQNAKHGFREINCNFTFVNNKNQQYDIYPEFGMPGVVIHTDCWKYAKNVLNRGLTLEDFNLRRFKQKSKWYLSYLMSYLNYDVITQYYAQDFNQELLITHPQNFYLLYSPMTQSSMARKNQKRIKANIKQLDKHKPSTIKTPVHPAFLFKVGTKLIGSDGCQYIIKQVNKRNKWCKV
jgi:hypothetical protein